MNAVGPMEKEEIEIGEMTPMMVGPMSEEAAPFCTPSSYLPNFDRCGTNFLNYWGTRSIVAIVCVKLAVVSTFLFLFLAANNMSSNVANEPCLSEMPLNDRMLDDIYDTTDIALEQQTLETCRISRFFNIGGWGNYNVVVSVLPDNSRRAIADDRQTYITDPAQIRGSALLRTAANANAPRVMWNNEEAIDWHHHQKDDPFALEQRQQESSLTVMYPLTHTSWSPHASYAIVLNKYNTVPGHALLITDHFVPQYTPLSNNDLDAWYYSISSCDGVGLFNSNSVAGASQLHKHMQFVPYSELVAMRQASTKEQVTTIPIDDVIDDFNQDRPEYNILSDNINTYRLNALPYEHFIANLLSVDDWLLLQQKNTDHKRYSDYLKEVYDKLFEQVSTVEYATHRHDAHTASTTLSYNMLMTTRWMMLVPRTNRKMCLSFNRNNANGNNEVTVSLDINGFAFLGYLLVRDIDQETAIRSVSSAGGALRAVTYPYDAA